MSSIDDLQQAVADGNAATAAGFQALSDAMTELASDVQRLDDQLQNPDVSAVTAEIRQASADNTAKFNSIAQSIRDAIPTPTAPAPEPTPTDGTETSST